MADETRNVLQGTVSGPTVQAGSITGGVHFHGPAQPSAAGGSVPRELPACPAYVVGRKAELASIDRLVEPGGPGPAVIAISGVAGVGKSTLAVAWASRAISRFPDGQLYLHLGAFDPAGPVSPGDALGQALRSLGLTGDQVPRTLAEQSAVFRSMTAGRTLLLVLDNAVSAAQVRPLLPAAPTCVVLVTSRWRLGGLAAEGARFLTVEPLRRDAATAMLARAIGADRTTSDPAATADLVRMCGGLPIALALTAARLAIRRTWPVRRLAGELSEERRRLRGLTGREETSVQGAFDLSYQHLPAASARCYRALGLLPGRAFGSAVVAAALDAPDDEAARQLECLLEASMLSETAEDRYRMHDLVRLHARQRVEADVERPAMRRRILAWHLRLALAADQILTPYRRRDRHDPDALADGRAALPAGRDKALAWLDLERASLVGAVYDAAPDLPLLAWQLADAMWPLFHLRRHHHDRMRVDRIAVECAQRLGDPDLEARALRRWAFAHADVGQLRQAEVLFHRALRRYEEIGDEYGIAAAAEGLGMVALREGRHADAERSFSQQLAICQRLDNPRRCGLALLNLGVTANDAGLFQEAVIRLQEAATVFAPLMAVDPYNGARVRLELGRAVGRLGDRRRAGQLLVSALTDMRALDSRRGEALALHRLGELAVANGDVTEARAHLTRALDLYSDLADAEVAEVRELIGVLDAGVPPGHTDAHPAP